jgi:hypothetical protein
LELGFLEAYIKNDNKFGIKNLGRPTHNAVDFTETIEINNNMKIKSCQVFENGLLLWNVATNPQEPAYLLNQSQVNESMTCGREYILKYQKRISTNFNIEQHFNDVAPSHRNYQAINFVKEEGIVNGYTDGTFGPDKKINRAEFTKIVLLAKYSQEEIDKGVKGISYNEYFTDIAEDINERWYINYVNFAKKEGIITGYDDNTFGVAKNINFAEASKIVVNTLIEKMDLTKCKDENNEDCNWSDAFIQKLYDKSITLYDKGKLITRGQMAQIIYEVMK